MKKFLGTMLTTAAVFSVVSIASADTGAKVTGFYLGANAGTAVTTADYKVVGAGNIINDSGVSASEDSKETRTIKLNSGKAGALFGLMAGYNFQSGSVVFGAEIYGGFDTTKAVLFNDNESGASAEAALWKTTLKRQRYIGFAPRIGYMVTPNALVYARLGLEAGKWTAQVDPNSTALNLDKNKAGLIMASSAKAGVIAESSSVVKKSKSGLAFAPGVGVELFMTKNVFLRGEYTYLFGPTIKMTQNTNGYAYYNWNGEKANHTVKIRQHAVKFAIGYKF